MRTTFIQLPHDISDPIVLRRFLDKLVQQIDEAFSLRGTGGFASTDMATRLNKDIAKSTKGYMKVDGSNISSVLSYPSKYSITKDTNLTHKAYVDAQKLVPASSPSMLSGSVSNDELRDKINELIVALKSNGVLT